MLWSLPLLPVTLTSRDRRRAPIRPVDPGQVQVRATSRGSPRNAGPPNVLAMLAFLTTGDRDGRAAREETPRARNEHDLPRSTGSQKVRDFVSRYRQRSPTAHSTERTGGDSSEPATRPGYSPPAIRRTRPPAEPGHPPNPATRRRSPATANPARLADTPAVASAVERAAPDSTPSNRTAVRTGAPTVSRG